MLLSFLCVKDEILRYLYHFISTFLTKVACCRNIEIVLHPATLSYVYVYIYIYISGNFIMIFVHFYRINIIKLCRPLSKLDLPTLHQGIRENERNGTN